MVRIQRSLVAVVVALSMACSARGPVVATVPDPVNPCRLAGPGPDMNPGRPIVCVDDSAFPIIELRPPYDTDVHLFTTKTMHWFTSSGVGTIAIVFDSDLLDVPEPKVKNGHTKVKAKNTTGSVKYSVLVQRGGSTSRVIDPTIIIDTCCS